MTVKQFKIGTPFIIIGKPRFWSSDLCDNSPFLGKITFPYHGVIIDINKYKYMKGYSYAMTDGKYGWDLTDLTELNLIKIDEVRMRKVKLIKLNKV